MKTTITNETRKQISNYLVRTARWENMGITEKAVRRGTTCIAKQFRRMLASGQLNSIQEQDIYDAAKQWLFVGSVR